MLLGLWNVGNWQNKVWMVLKKKKCCTFSCYKDGGNIYLEYSFRWQAAVQYWNKGIPIRFISGFLSVHFYGTITDMCTQKEAVHFKCLATNYILEQSYILHIQNICSTSLVHGENVCEQVLSGCLMWVLRSTTLTVKTHVSVKRWRLQSWVHVRQSQFLMSVSS